MRTTAICLLFGTALVVGAQQHQPDPTDSLPNRTPGVVTYRKLQPFSIGAMALQETGGLATPTSSPIETTVSVTFLITETMSDNDYNNVETIDSEEDNNSDDFDEDKDKDEDDEDEDEDADNESNVAENEENSETESVTEGYEDKQTKVAVATSTEALLNFNRNLVITSINSITTRSNNQPARSTSLSVSNSASFSSITLSSRGFVFSSLTSALSHNTPVTTGTATTQPTSHPTHKNRKSGRKENGVPKVWSKSYGLLYSSLIMAMWFVGYFA